MAPRASDSGGSSIAAMEAGSGAHIKLSGRGQLLPGTDRRVVFLSGPFRAVMDATELALGLVSGARVAGVRASPLHTPRRARCRGYSVAGHPRLLIRPVRV